MPGIVKNFTYMNYEGTQAKTIQDIQTKSTITI